MTSQDKTLRDRVAKAIADAVGHGMAEKCERQADAAIAALAPAAEAVAEIKWAGPIPQKVLEWKDGVNRFITDNPIGTRIYTTPQPTQAAEAVAWSYQGTITNDDGVPVGDDEIQIHWGPEPPDDRGWHPLFDNTTPQPAPVVDAPTGTDEEVEAMLRVRQMAMVTCPQDWQKFAGMMDRFLAYAALAPKPASDEAGSA